MPILKSREEKNSFINKLLGTMEDIHYATNSDFFAKVDTYILDLYRDHESISKLNLLIDEALDLEKELREITTRYRAIKDRVITCLNDSGYYKFFKEHYEVRTAIFDSRRIKFYREYIVQQEVMSKFGDIYFDNKKHRILINNFINTHISSYDSIDRFINYTLYEFKEHYLIKL